MRTILLSMIAVSTFLSADFSRDNNGIVQDSKTGLFWQDDYSDNGDSVKSANWTDAIDYCETLSLNSQTDWRLPNKKELLSIVNYDTYTPSINSVFQKNTSGNYWSSTTYASYTNYAWLVNFNLGYTVYSDKSGNGRRVRCVRAGQ